jgi:hypothetical protein
MGMIVLTIGSVNVADMAFPVMAVFRRQVWVGKLGGGGLGC